MAPVRSILLLLAAGLWVLSSVVGWSSAQEATPEIAGVSVFPPDQRVHGATLEEWSARHWQWTVSFPVKVNPGQDVSGATCGYGQSAPVFFIPRNFPPCTVPAGMAIFVPIAGTVCSSVELRPSSGQGEAALRSCAAEEANRYTGIVVRVDGQEVPNIESYRVASPRFPIILPENNVLGAPARAGTAVADGYQVIVAPLPPGEHEIMVHVELTDGTILPDKVLHLTVIEPVDINQGATPLPATPGATPLP